MPPPDNNKPILVLDFDGVVTRDGDGPTEGFFEWAVEANKYFKLVIHSHKSRDSEEGADWMQDWLQTHVISWRHSQLERNSALATALLEFDFPTHRPDAFLTIDDRAITFTGRWNAPNLRPEALSQFLPWHDEKYERPEADEERPSNVVPPPNVKNVCPRHPWMTMQEPNGKRHCTATGCTWQG